MRKVSSTASLAVVFAALYAVGVVVLAPISFFAFQVRVADALLPLSILFGWPAILGLSIGAFVANFFGGLGPVDIVGGAIANFVAGVLAWKVASDRRLVHLVVAVALQIVVVTLIVGTYLSFLLAIPLEAGLIGVAFGSMIAIGILGSLLLFALSRKSVVDQLKSH
jgi:uncharacterized membrane protein